MPAGGPVSVRRQCIYAAIPVLDIYSAYHIRKLRRYLLVILCTVLIPQVAVEFALFDSMLEIQEAYTAFLYPESEHSVQSIYVMLWTAGSIAWSVVLIRRWSMKWNAGRPWDHHS